MAPPGIRPSPLGIGLIVTLVGLSLYYFAGNFIYVDQTVSMRSLLIASIDIAERGGDKVREIREQQSDLDAESKGDTKEGAKMLVTEGDFASNRAMVQSLHKSFPNILIVSEERDQPEEEEVRAAATTNDDVDAHLVVGDDEQISGSDITVWIDPLDATQEYSEDLRQYVTTMVCVAVRGVPVLGVIHKPFEHKTYWAWVKHGSNLMYKPPDQAHENSIIVSRSHAGSVEQVAHEAFGDDAIVTPAGGAGYKTLALFDGTASLYVHTTLIKKWDICAGNAILEHFGGKMTTLAGAAIDYTSSQVKNEGGLLAAYDKHAQYVEQLGPVLRDA